jgi:hypothetical protein
MKKYLVRFYTKLGEHRHDEIMLGLCANEVENWLKKNALYPTWTITEWRGK